MAEQQNSSLSQGDDNHRNFREQDGCLSPDNDGHVPRPQCLCCHSASTRMSQGRLKKNLLTSSVSLVLLLTAYGGLESLQSSLNAQDNKGVFSLSVLYSSLLLSSILLAKPIVFLLGYKACMTVSMLSYIMWIAANGYPQWPLLIGCSVLVGVSAATLWTAQRLYVSTLSRRYAELRDQEWKDTMAKFFGIARSIFVLRTYPVQKTEMHTGKACCLLC